ncbi:MAG: hypothetical protein SFX73_21875 [Kofleriaceae bacterium]|nr:hypothetical protein [Kofleriaceae bacterium]
MYRDDATALDEHDRAVGSILIGETLVAQCERSATQLADKRSLPADRWRAVRDIHDDYTEIWRQLDRAKKILDARGANTMGYEELRPHVKPSLSMPTDERTAVEAAAFNDVRRAIEQLKLAVPGTDWKAIDKRSHQLSETPGLHRRHRAATAAILAVFVTFAAGYMVTMAQDKEPDPAALMRREIAAIAKERKLKIAMTNAMLGKRCDPPLAHDYVKLLAMDGRKDDAMAFADSYTIRCGEDRVVLNWANAPRVVRR